MAKCEPLKVVNMISLDGINGEYKPLEECNAEELELFRSKVRERMSRSLSDYFSANPDELDKLMKDRRTATA